jgi:glycosyltransferase involved in cell wall biosynthesis
VSSKLIVSLYFSYVSKSGGVIDFAENLVRALLRQDPGVVVLRPSSRIKHEKSRTLLRFLAEAWVSVARWGSKQSVLFPNYFFVPIPWRRSLNVVVVHDLMFRHYPQYVGRAKRFVLHVSYLLVRRWADGVVFISKDSQDDFLRLYGEPKRYTYIYNPVVLPEHLASVERLHGPGADEPYAIANFHFYPHKNFAKLLEVFYALRELRPKLKLVLTGNKPPDFESLLGRSPHAQAVVHLGFLPKDQVLAVVRDASFFLSMSQFEGFNMSAAEAALLNKPLVLSDIPVHRELFASSAWLVDIKAPTLNAPAISAFLDSFHADAGLADLRHRVDPDSVASQYRAFVSAVESGAWQRKGNP